MDKNYYVVMHNSTIYAQDGSCSIWNDAVTPTVNAMELMRAVRVARERLDKLHSEVALNHLRIIRLGDFHITYESKGDVVSVRFEVVHV